MSILDPHGNPVSSLQRKFNRSASNDGKERPWMPERLADIGKLIPKNDRDTLVAVSRGLIENWAPARAIARQIPMYSVGKAWKPSLMTDNAVIKSSVESVIRNQFCEITDLQGRDFSTAIYHIAHLLIRDGEVFYLLTEWDTGFPAIQIIPCHRIGQREWGFNLKVQKGRYEGLDISEGVIRNKYGTPVAYRVLGDTPDKDEDISARSLKHVYDSDYPEAQRGYPALTHGLNDGRDGLQAHEWERLNMLARSSRTMIEWNETGTPSHEPSNHFDGDGLSADGCQDMSIKNLQGGTWTHFKAGTGSKLQAVLHETPGEVWESYQDRLVWKLCAGVPWPTSFVKSDTGKGGGTAERRDIMQARQTIEDMQTTLEKVAKSIMGYAYKKLVKIERLPDSVDWWKWSFSKPPKITIDDGRANKAALEMWRAGVISDEDLLSDMGKDHEEFWREKFNKAADKEIAFEEIQKVRGVSLDARYKGMFNPQEMNMEQLVEEKTQTKENEEE